MGKQLVSFITCGSESSAHFFVIYKAGVNPRRISDRLVVPPFLSLANKFYVYRQYTNLVYAPVHDIFVKSDLKILQVLHKVDLMVLSSSMYLEILISYI
jgi:hypothetical protein